MEKIDATAGIPAIPFSLANPWKFPLHGLPLRCSVPFPQGELKDPARELALVDETGADCAAQWRVLSTWNDGSVRFALLDYAEAVLPPRTTKRYTLQSRGETSVGAPHAAITVTEDAETLTVDTGRLRWTFSKTRFSLGEALVFHNRDWFQGQSSDLCVLDDQGVTYRASQGDYRLRVEAQGPYRVIVRLEGNHGKGDARFLDYDIRLHFTTGGSQVLMLHHVRNRHGGREGRQFQRCWLEGSLNVDHTAVRRIEHELHSLFTMHRALDCPERVDLDTDSFPTAYTPDPFLSPANDRRTAWTSPQTRIRNGESLREADEEICVSINEKNPGKTLAGDRRGCAPMIDLHEPGAGGMLVKFAMASPEAEYPLHLGSERNGFEIDFFPPWRQPHHFSEGMGKTRDVLINFHDDSLEAMDLFHESGNLSYPGVVSPGAMAYRRAEFADLHRTMPFQPNKYPLLESKIDLFKMTSHGFLWPNAFGWKHYGDEVGARGTLTKQGIVQFINNEEDYLYCTMIDAWRRGAAVGSTAMARHLMDIDYIDYSDDPSRNGATCPHSEDHTNGEVYTSHQWCQGLLYYYLATGDEEALRIARRIGDCLVWWITGPMSYALRFSGRETSWPLLSLSALYEVTHEEKYKEAAMKVVDDMLAIQQEHGAVVWEYPAGSGIYSGYMLTMAFNGIWDVWAATGEERALQLWKDITKPVIDTLERPEDWGYVIFRNWQIKVADLTVLVRWYELTGDEKYIRLGKNGLRLIMSGAPQLDSQYQGFFAMWYRHLILFLKNADEFGMIDDEHCTMVW